MSEPTAIGEIVNEAKARLESHAQEKREWEDDRAKRERWGRLMDLARDTGPRLDPHKVCTLPLYEVYHHDQKAIVAKVQEWIDHAQDNIRTGAGMIVIGRRGTGKDHLCISAAREAIRTCEVSVRWVDGRDLFRIALDDVRGEGGGNHIREYAGTGILILSDPIQPGVELRDYQQDVLWRIVNQRYQRCLPTFVTSNCKDLQEFEKGIGTAMLSRLRHNATMVLCNWPDYRERK